MATTALLTNASANSNPASLTGTASQASSVFIEIPGSSVFNGAEVTIQASSTNTAANFSPIASIAALQSPGNVVITCPTGHFIRAVLNRAATGTSITCNMIDIT
jgi:hypothetical protein